MILKSRNGKLMILVIVFIVLFLGIGSVFLNKIFFSNYNEEDDYYSDESISTPVVAYVGFPDGEVSIHNETVQKLFNYFKEDRNCLFENSNNINGSNSSKLMFAYNSLYEGSEVVSCNDVSKLVLYNQYYCGLDASVNKDDLSLGINSNSFLNYVRKNNTIVVSAEQMDNAINDMFGVGAGYIREDFKFSNDSYIYYDGSNAKYVMYKYQTYKECVKYDEELIEANSIDGKLTIRSGLSLNGKILKYIVREFKFNENTGRYDFVNRYAM